jgi:hypothetical protein
MESTKAYQWRNLDEVPYEAGKREQRVRGENWRELTVRDMASLAERRRGMNVRVMMAKVGSYYQFIGYDMSGVEPSGLVRHGFVETQPGTALAGQRLFANRVLRTLQSGAPAMELEVYLSQRTEDFHARIYQVIGREGRPVPNTTYQLTPREMIRLADAWGEIDEPRLAQRAELRKLAAGASEPAAADVQRVLRSSPPRGRGGGTPPPPPPAPSGGGGPQGAPPTTATSTAPGSAGAQGGQSGRKPPVSARDVAAEVARTMREVQRLEKMARFVRWGLGAWQAVNVLSDVAKSVNMATAILAQGSPFAAQIRHADTIESTAKEIAEHYHSFDLRALRMSDQDPSWRSFYDVYQAQLNFLAMEQSFHEALKEVQAARRNLKDQMNALRDEMASKTDCHGVCGHESRLCRGRAICRCRWQDQCAPSGSLRTICNG